VQSSDEYEQYDQHREHRQRDNYHHDHDAFSHHGGVGHALVFVVDAQFDSCDIGNLRRPLLPRYALPFHARCPPRRRI